MPVIVHSSVADSHYASAALSNAIRGAAQALQSEGPFGDLAREFAIKFDWLEANRLSSRRALACYVRDLFAMTNPWCDGGYFCAPVSDEDRAYAAQILEWIWPKALELGIKTEPLDNSGLPAD
jgi:hypothetical protein